MSQKVFLVGVPILVLFLLGNIVVTRFTGEPYPAILQPGFSNYRTAEGGYSDDYITITAYTADGDSLFLEPDRFFDFFNKGRGVKMYKKMFAEMPVAAPLTGDQPSLKTRLRKMLIDDHRANLAANRERRYPAMVQDMGQRAAALTGTPVSRLRFDLIRRRTNLAARTFSDEHLESNTLDFAGYDQ